MQQSLLITFALCTALMLSACAETPVDPKLNPQNFKIKAWIQEPQLQADGHLGEPKPGTDELNNVLAREFPVGTQRSEIEKYLLASGDLHVSRPMMPPKSPEKIQGLQLINYEKKREYDEGFVGIHAYYNQRNLLAKPLALEGANHTLFNTLFDF